MNVNVFQVQRLLNAVGHSPGNIDGIWGPKSQAALDEALAEREKTICEDLTDPVSNRTFWGRSEYMKREEYKCKCGGKYCNGYPAEPEELLVMTENQVRKHFGRPAINSSGLRCDTWNRLQGGVPGSRHRLGKAVDFRIDGIPSATLLAYIKTLPAIRYAYQIDGSYVHMDIP